MNADVIQPDCQQRREARESLRRACEHYPAWQAQPEDDRAKTLRHMERGCMRLAVDACIEENISRRWSNKEFVNMYSRCLYKLLSNLDNKSSVGDDHLIHSILGGVYTAKNAAYLTSVEMSPGSSAADRAAIAARLDQKITPKISRAYRCAKCGGEETTLHEYAGRAADESMVLSIRCIECGHVWRK